MLKIIDPFEPAKVDPTRPQWLTDYVELGHGNLITYDGYSKAIMGLVTGPNLPICVAYDFDVAVDVNVSNLIKPDDVEEEDWDPYSVAVDDIGFNWNGYIGKTTPFTIYPGDAATLADFDEELDMYFPEYRKAFVGTGNRCSFETVQVYDVNLCVSIVKRRLRCSFEKAVRAFHTSEAFQWNVNTVDFKKCPNDYPVFLYTPYEEK
jgi:hypothetical protein